MHGLIIRLLVWLFRLSHRLWLLWLLLGRCGCFCFMISPLPLELRAGMSPPAVRQHVLAAAIADEATFGTACPKREVFVDIAAYRPLHQGA